MSAAEAASFGIVRTTDERGAAPGSEGAAARLAAGLAHDLNNIILVMQGYAEMALAEPDAGPGVRALIADMTEATARASRLVSDLQVIGERGQFTPRLLDLSEVVRRRLQGIASTCPAGIVIRTALADGLYPLLADEDLLGRILDALCARARDALPDGGVVTITTEPGTLGAEGSIVLRIHDTGPALTEEMRARFFQPYPPGPRGGSGQGLGLAVVSSAVKRLGGRIRVSSEEGTTVEISFPASITRGTIPQPRSVEPLPCPRASAVEGAKGVTILLAEDDENLRGLAVKVLTREGYTVLSARDGQEAVDIWLSARPRIRLALLDDVMPRMGGRAALTRMHEEDPAFPVIICSGYAWHFDALAPQSGGYCETLQKPWQPRELLQKVREGLRSRP
jgi:two-component system cell cycle sensor histidine kinase/response regulator CckA